MKKPSKPAKKAPKPKSAPAAPRKRTPAPVAEDVHKFEAAKPSKARKAPARPRSKAAAGPDIDALGELPRSYGEPRIFVVAQEPHWLFCYWDYTLTDGVEHPVFLRHGQEGAAPEGEARVPVETNSWYLSVRDAGANYFVELGYYDDGTWNSLTRSAQVLTPRDTLAGFGEPVFANMPFHLTFQQLVEKLRGEMRQGESLAEALARLQSRGEIPGQHLSAAQRVALDTLLSSQLGSLSSGDLARLLSSGASWFSGALARSSWGEVGASWSQAPGGVPGGLPAGLAALLQLVGVTSWTGASWESAFSSWAGGGESSFGVPGSAMFSGSIPPRGFFMHVNAEVIFYGGTHPDAKVTIDGKPVTLRPDGSFRYHFVFPDGEFEIPIIATSPDGVETRRAVLRFERATGREGDVGATAQPPIAAPMGRKKK